MCDALQAALQAAVQAALQAALQAAVQAALHARCRGEGGRGRLSRLHGPTWTSASQMGRVGQVEGF